MAKVDGNRAGPDNAPHCRVQLLLVDDVTRKGNLMAAGSWMRSASFRRFPQSNREEGIAGKW
jgi:hypothetical protein